MKNSKYLKIFNQNTSVLILTKSIAIFWLILITGYENILHLIKNFMVFNYFRKPSPGYWKQFAKLKLFSNIFSSVSLISIKNSIKIIKFSQKTIKYHLRFVCKISHQFMIISFGLKWDYTSDTQAMAINWYNSS